MAIRLAHLSDLHFGRAFDYGLWRAVKADVKGFRPHLLIISGDVVDDPVPLHLLAAKCELHDFAADMKSSLVVVPGNHDVFLTGIKSGVTPRVDWFDRIFFNDTTEAEKVATEEFGARPSFDRSFLKTSHRVVGLLDRWLGRSDGTQSFERHIAKSGAQDLVERPDDCSILVARLDSTRISQPIGFATGEVHKDDLVALSEKLDAISEPYLVRVAVVHHHVLPISFSGGRWIGAEPLMALHNAGTVLSVLKDHHFDLVLHGHKHVPQFARVDLMPQHAAGYPMTVVAAGSACLETSSATGNCLNYVTVSENGRIEVESCYYGAGGAPPERSGSSDRYVRYEEPLASAKRRAHRRAVERHPVRCAAREISFEISESGDLFCESATIGLRGDLGDRPVERLHNIALADDSWFVDGRLELVECSHQLKFILPPADEAATSRKGARRCFTVYAPDGALKGDGLSYRAKWACANGANMTRWETEQRAPVKERQDGWDVEWLGASIGYPVDRLSFRLRLPTRLAGVRPKIECRRPRCFPNYEISATGDVVPAPDMVVDDDITRHELESFRFEPDEGLWRLDVTEPMAGYSYRIVWKTPVVEVNYAIQAEVIQQRELLLATRKAGAWPQSAKASFAILADEIEKVFAHRSEREARAVDLMVYDSDKVALPAVLSRRNWTTKPVASDFAVPLGRGIAGAAFQQGRVIPWARTVTDSPFIMPFPYEDEDEEPNVELRSLLAIPIFHRSQMAVERPPLWSCLGVISFGSSLDATAIPALMQASEHDEIMNDLRGARGLAHAVVDSIVRDLEGLPTQSS